MNKEQSTKPSSAQSSTVVVPLKGKGKPAKGKELQAAKKKPEPKGKGGKVKWNEKYRPGTIGRMIADEIMAGKLDNQAILEKVKKEHKSKTTYACITWYRTHARAAKAVE